MWQFLISKSFPVGFSLLTGAVSVSGYLCHGILMQVVIGKDTAVPIGWVIGSYAPVVIVVFWLASTIQGLKDDVKFIKKNMSRLPCAKPYAKGEVCEDEP